MISFSQFKSQVIADMGKSWNSDMDYGFRNFQAEIGYGGYQFQVSSQFGAYCYEDGEWYYDGGRGSGGRGATLAQAQAEEAANYDAAFV